MPRLARTARIALIGSALAGVAVALLAWGRHVPPGMRGISITMKGLRQGTSPNDRLASWINGLSAPRTPLGLVRLFEAGELATFALLIAVLSVLAVVLVRDLKPASATALADRRPPSITRFSVRACVILVALVAVWTAVEIDGRRVWSLRVKHAQRLASLDGVEMRYREDAGYARSLVGQLQASEALEKLPDVELRSWVKREYAGDLAAAVAATRRRVDVSEAYAAYFAALRPKYVRAVRRPRDPVEPDPPFSVESR